VKHLPKHLQPRWRYLAVTIETWPDAEFDRGDYQRELWYAAQNLLGDAASAELDLTVVRFRRSDAEGDAVIRVRRGEVDRGRAVLACLDSVAGDPVGQRVRGVSGTVRACEEKYLGRAPEPTNQRNVAFADGDRRASVRGRRVDVRLSDEYAGATELDLQ
jgi:ribonuclease P/MRP protein subunit POP5